VEDPAGIGVCALVLASGQFMFSCNPNGPYSLLDLPTESDGTVKRQIYADGFFPNVEILQSSVDETVVMTRVSSASGICPDYNSFPDPGVFPDSAGKRIDISGTVLLQDTQTPLCAMVIANGASGFTCDGTGNYAANIPLDDIGQFKLQVNADGFVPSIQRFDEFSPINDVRLARAVECVLPPDSNTVCDQELCAADDTLAQQCDTFLQNCLTAPGVLDEQCVGGALLICEGGPPDDVDEGNVCSRDLCAEDAGLAQQCETFLVACLSDIGSDRQCVGGAFFICRELF
jgi:hypothetical protein